MTDNTNRLAAILIAAVALIGLGCAVAVANTSNTNTNTTDTTADDYSTYTYIGTTSSDVAAKKMSAEEISMLTSDLVGAQVMCESANMALGQFNFAMPAKAAFCDEIAFVAEEAFAAEEAAAAVEETAAEENKEAVAEENEEVPAVEGMPDEEMPDEDTIKGESVENKKESEPKEEPKKEVKKEVLEIADEKKPMFATQAAA